MAKGRPTGAALTQRAKTHCPQGHPYDEANTRVGKRGDGRTFRICRACSLATTHKLRGPEKPLHRGPRRAREGSR